MFDSLERGLDTVFLLSAVVHTDVGSAHVTGVDGHGEQGSHDADGSFPYLSQ